MKVVIKGTGNGKTNMAPPHSLGLDGRFSGTLKPTGTQVTSFHLFDAIIRGERDFDVVIFADEKFPGVAAWRTIPHTHKVRRAGQTVDMRTGNAPCLADMRAVVKLRSLALKVARASSTHVAQFFCYM